MSENLNLVRKYTLIYSFKNTPFSTNTFLVLLMSGFICKKSAFFGKKSISSQSNSVRAVPEIF